MDLRLRPFPRVPSSRPSDVVAATASIQDDGREGVKDRLDVVGERTAACVLVTPATAAPAHARRPVNAPPDVDHGRRATSALGARSGASEHWSIRGLISGGGTTELESRLVYLARRRFRIPWDTAPDLVQASLVAFLGVQHRYPKESEHPKILVGIFRNKCRDYIAKSVRAARALNALKASVESGDATIAGARTRARSNGGVLGEVVRREDGHRVVQAIASLSAPARELFRLITEEELSRPQLIQRLGINANTLDSRLHAYRNDLRKVLRRDGLGT